MTTEIATYSMAGQTFDVEIIEDFRYGLTEVIALGCYPFYGGGSHATVETSSLHNRRVEEIPDDLPIPADPGVDEVIEVYESMYAHVNDMRAGVA